jgi:hypothetical protein
MQQTVSIALFVVVIVAGAFLLGRDNESSVTQSSANEGVTAVAFTPLAEGVYSRVEARVNYLVSSEEGLVELWKLIETDMPLPQVDFSTHAVAAIFAGEEATAGFKIAVAAVEDGAERMVKVVRTRPGPSCMTTQVITMPYQVVEIPITTLPLSHQDEWMTEDCSS